MHVVRMYLSVCNCTYVSSACRSVCVCTVCNYVRGVRVCSMHACVLHACLSIYLRNSRAELLELWGLLEILGLWEILGPGQLLEPGYARPLELPKKS